MQRKLIILSILLLITASIIGCTQLKTSMAGDVSLMEPIIKNKNSINIIVDPRIELLSIVQMLSKYSEEFSTEITIMDFEYKGKIMEHFGEFKNHKAVKTFEKMIPGFSYDAPPGLMLFMNEDFGVRNDTKLTDYIINRANGRGNIDRLFNDLKEFCIDTDFNDFYNENHDYYDEIIDTTLDLISSDENVVEDLEEYYGMKQKSYNIVLVSLYGNGAYGPSIDTPNGKEIYSIMGPTMIDFSGMPLFSSRTNLQYLTQHEFSHSFINPITDKNYELAYTYEELFEPIKENMTDMVYGHWHVSLNEHIIRALTARFAYYEDRDNGKRILINEKGNGFVYIDALFDKLEEYENNRDKYPTIEDFYPELLKSLDRYKKD